MTPADPLEIAILMACVVSIPLIYVVIDTSARNHQAQARLDKALKSPGGIHSLTQADFDYAMKHVKAQDVIRKDK